MLGPRAITLSRNSTLKVYLNITSDSLSITVTSHFIFDFMRVFSQMHPQGVVDLLLF